MLRCSTITLISPHSLTYHWIDEGHWLLNDHDARSFLYFKKWICRLSTHCSQKLLPTIINYHWLRQSDNMIQSIVNWYRDNFVIVTCQYSIVLTGGLSWGNFLKILQKFWHEWDGVNPKKEIHVLYSQSSKISNFKIFQ
jgi:hypothetical protein